MVSERIVIGERSDLRPSVAMLAGAVISDAKRLGFRCHSMTASRHPLSSSKYLELEDTAGRRWIVRISNHFRPRRSTYALPHLDLVSHDGKSGRKPAREFLERVAAGDVTWCDTLCAARTPPRRRSKLRRSGRKDARRSQSQ